MARLLKSRNGISVIVLFISNFLGSCTYHNTISFTNKAICLGIVIETATLVRNLSAPIQ